MYTELGFKSLNNRNSARYLYAIFNCFQFLAFVFNNHNGFCYFLPTIYIFLMANHKTDI